jgi:hypothetical protein
MRVLIGIDDTDNEQSPGTGRLARNLGAALQERNMRLLGVTRHQFLLDPAIPYTSHNSGACIALEAPDGIESVRSAVEYVAKASYPGSDPGVCLAQADEVPDAVQAWGIAASQEVLHIADAFDLLRNTPIHLYGVGGTCAGVIGALASIGQYAEGNQGRFIDLPGLRELTGLVAAEQLKSLGIKLEHVGEIRYPAPTDRYDTLNWVRPTLTQGRPVLAVEWSEQTDAWIPVDRKKTRPLE